MSITYVDQDVVESREGVIQVGCKVCFMAQDIPTPPRNENLTVYQCVHCEAINTVNHNLADWRRANFISGCILRLVLLLCALFVLGAVGWVTWLFL